jgi:uncharacterized protein (DUF1501 family)
MKPESPLPSRRDFLRRACCAAVGSTGLVSALAQLRTIGALAATSAGAARAASAPPDYKALVCLFLNGGNDGDGFIVPTDAGSYAAYATARGALAVDRAALLPLAPRRYADGRTYGLHPSTPELRTLFAQGRLAVLANVGTLLRPTSLAQYRSGSGLPPQLFSHVDQVMHWQSSLPDRPFATGWGGRLADLTDAFNSSERISMAITLNGANSFQVGRTVTQLAVNPTGVQLLNGYGAGGNTGLRYAGAKSLLAAPRSNLLEAAFGATGTNAIENSEVLSAALAGVPALATPFPGSFTGSRLAMIARLIAAAPALGLKRQIFFCQLGGFDLHAGQVGAHGLLLAEVSAAMAAFHAATVELGVANQVTTFTASDFGRTYVVNGDGTDHGWGNHQLIMGGAVKGGDIYGRMPSLVVNGPDDVGRGRWIPSTSVDEYKATLATWFGVSATDLTTVLPNLGRFATRDLGFMT